MAGIHKIIEEPFGPYPQSDILSDNYQPKQNQWPPLTGVFLRHNEITLGLDDSEHLNQLPSKHPLVVHEVQWFGILQVESLSWLSKQGYDWLEDDLRKRDMHYKMQLKKNATSGLTLKALYGHTKDEGLQVKVYLQGIKRQNMSYLTNKHHPTSLILHTAGYTSSSGHEIYRNYIVESLDVEMIPLSRNFFTRYQLLANMEDIVSNHPGVPRVARDIDYWVDGYLSLRRENEHHHRYIFDPEDSDVDDNGDTGVRRHLRHLPRSEVTSIYASQAEWVLAQQLGISQGQKRLVDLHEWHAFCKLVRRMRLRASSEGTQWGLPYRYKSTDGELSLKDYLKEKFFVTEKQWKQLSKPTTTRQKSKTKSASLSPTASEYNTPIEPINHIYDSDFSVSSSSADSDTEPEQDGSADVLSIIPRFCWEPPRLLDGSFDWDCPEEGCNYRLNLLDISNVDLSVLSSQHANYLRQKRWSSIADPHIQSAFYEIVGIHYKWHINEAGVDYSIRDGRVFWKGIYPRPQMTQNQQLQPPLGAMKDKSEEEAYSPGIASGSRSHSRSLRSMLSHASTSHPSSR